MQATLPRGAASDPAMIFRRLPTRFPWRWRRHRRRKRRPRPGRPTGRLSETHPRYPGLTSHPVLIEDFDTDPTLPLIRYRILIDGREDAAGEFHNHPATALGEVTGMMCGNRYAPYGLYMAEAEVYDADGGLIGRDRQVRAWHFGRLTVVWKSELDRWRQGRWTRWIRRWTHPPVRDPYRHLR